MPRPWRVRYAGAKYHLTARGNGREVIFTAACDYERFLEQLKAALEQDEVVLYAYVIMPNHYHLLVETPLGNVQRFMQRLNTAYGMYFRYKHNKAGHCFQGRYGARLVDGDDYLVRLTRYIHLNPVKTKRFKDAVYSEKEGYLNNYRWSSYRSYAGLAVQDGMINHRWLKLMGRMTQKGNQAAYRKYISQMLGAEDAVLTEGKGRSVYAVGDRRFIERAAAEMKAAQFAKSDTGDIAWPEKPRKAVAEVLGPILKELGLKEEDLKRHGRALGATKGIAIELLCQLSGGRQREIAPYCGYARESVVGKQRRSLRDRMEADKTLKIRFDSIREKLWKKLNA